MKIIIAIVILVLLVVFWGKKSKKAVRLNPTAKGVKRDD